MRDDNASSHVGLGREYYILVINRSQPPYRIQLTQDDVPRRRNLIYEAIIKDVLIVSLLDPIGYIIGATDHVSPA